MNMIELRDFKAGYHDKIMVEVPHLSVAKGNKCLVTGASGSGKTTLLYALAGLGQAVQGSVVVDSIDVYKLDTTKQDRFRGNTIGIVFQTLHLVKSLSVVENNVLDTIEQTYHP